MKVEGNLDHLKKEIENSYKEKLMEFKKHADLEFKEEKKQIDEGQKKALERANNELDEEEKKVFKSTLSEEKLTAKKDYENKREALINKVFDEASNKAKKTLISKDYLSFVKKFLKENGEAKIIGGYKEYNKTFKDAELDEKVNGILVKKDKMIFDFTYTKFIESRKLDLRHKVSNILFENVN
ncbi:MAG: hypothetical protein ACTSYA_06605 [Candidatus Kariarchaeaceae archaeon]